jgi:uncharacterized protein YbjT (DUF2867 family)
VKQLNKVVVLGGSGFVGSTLVAKLDAAGYEVTVLTRRRDRAKHLFLLPNVKVQSCNIFNEAELTQALTGAHVVINLIGILHQSRRLRFDQVHHQLPNIVASICVQLGIKRLIHMSSLGASAQAPSAYLQSKAAGELALSEYHNLLNITVFKPSIIFGRGDAFINLFATLIKFLPVILLAKPNAQFQPIWVEDVATCFVESVNNVDTYGKTYELAGSKVYSFRQLLEKIMVTLGVKRPIVGLSDGLSLAQGFMMEFLPIKLMSRDNVRSMEVDSVSHAPFPSVFGVSPAPLESVMPDYLNNQNPRGYYDDFRSAAGRAINARR